jgi:hypothetical protein
MQNDSIASVNLLSELPDHLVAGLFSGATPVRLKARRYFRLAMSAMAVTV